MQVGDALEALREEVRALRLAVESRPMEKQAVTLVEAGRMLSVSLRTMQRLVKSGVVLTVRVGDRPLVPTAEIRRIATPGPTSRRPSRARKVAAPTAEEMAARIRALR